jgi:hypothetical protein
MTATPVFATHIVRTFLEILLDQSRERFQELEAKIAELEARPAGVSYQGTWDATKVYGRDQAITWGGSLWIAKSASIGKKPPDACWQLAVRKALTVAPQRMTHDPLRIAGRHHQ